jgi:S1-C subfamily serine protease
MADDILSALSQSLADAIETTAPSVVQVQGRRRPVSGLVYDADVVVTMVRALGRGDGLHVRRHDGEAFDAELAGWDPTTGLAVLRAHGLDARPIVLAKTDPRVGNLAIAIARSWSNAVTASAGIVAVIGGPLRTGRHRAIDRVLRTTAPMHDGFAGGAFTDTGGALVGVATAASIRGLSVVIPASTAWKTAATVLEHGGLKRGYLGIAGQPVRLSGAEAARQPSEGLLVVAITEDSPAAAAGVLVGDILIAFDGEPIQSPEDLLDLLIADRIGRQVKVALIRGGRPEEIVVTVGERPTH